MFISLLFSTLNLIIGFLLGVYSQNPQEITNRLENISKKAKKFKNKLKGQEIGGVTALSVEELNKTPIEIEEEKEMEELLNRNL